LLAPQRGLIAIDQNQNREPFIVQSIGKFLSFSFLRKQESVRLQAGAIGEVKVLSQEMPAPDS